MAKKTVKAVTRKQKYLAAIAGEGVAPSPITSDEKLMYNIAEKVNEGGSSGGGVLVVHDVDGTLDKTWQEIHDAMLTGIVVANQDEGAAVIVFTYCFTEKGNYAVGTLTGSQIQYETDSASGYPALP